MSNYSDGRYDRAAVLQALTTALNCNSVDATADTPDYILAGYLLGCLDNFIDAKLANDQWHGHPKLPDRLKALSSPAGAAHPETKD